MRSKEADFLAKAIDYAIVGDYEAIPPLMGNNLEATLQYGETIANVIRHVSGTRPENLGIEGLYTLALLKHEGVDVKGAQITFHYVGRFEPAPVGDSPGRVEVYLPDFDLSDEGHSLSQAGTQAKRLMSEVLAGKIFAKHPIPEPKYRERGELVGGSKHLLTVSFDDLVFK